MATKRQKDNPDALIAELLLDAGLFHAEADIKWLAMCEAKIKQGLVGS